MAGLLDSLTFPGTAEWGTPRPLFEPHHMQWSFTIDPAASHGNALVSHYFTPDGEFRRGPVDPVVCPDSFGPVVPAHKWEHLPERPNEEICLRCSVLHETLGGPEQIVRVSYLDGLQSDWNNERFFMNPPWGDPEDICEPDCTKRRCESRGQHIVDYRLPGIAEFLAQAVHQVLWNRAQGMIVAPARTDTQWFHRWLYRKHYVAELEFIKGRPKFIHPETGLPGEQPPVGVLLATLR